MTDRPPRKPQNQLSCETSPYLRQHMDNPVDWLPWGAAAFARAQQQDRPILLSIGYSACHWCHVMAHESFEDVETADQMNRDFINIKVDREEHPDVDQLYQHALNLFDQHGGWPLTIFLLPTGEPFYGGTYFPPREAYGRPSFRRVLSAISDAYRQRRGELLTQATKLVEALTQLGGRGAGQAASGELPADLAERAASKLAARADRLRGGFEGAPKFPNPTSLSLFLRAFGRSRKPDTAAPTLLTLAKMADGGIYDQLGGGFARYSTDADWLVPHFEKMLYDNAQLLRLYAEASQIFGELGQPLLASRCADVIAETHGWLEREMRDSSGGLYAAQDADSEGVEGKFFVWSPEEIAAVLDPESARLFCHCYDVRPGGNWNDPHGHGPPGKSILHVVAPPQDGPERALLQAARHKLRLARSERIPPATDSKILCSWNGLAVSGLAEAGRILAEPRYVDAARKTADFVLSQMQKPDPDGGLLRTFTDGVAKLPATLDDYAFFAEGLFFLASASHDLRYLVAMRRLMGALLTRFYDAEQRLFYLAPADSAGVALVARPVSLHDSAIPSGMSVACLNLLRLAALLDPADPDRRRYQDIAEALLLRLADQALRNPLGLSNVVAALDLLQHGLTTAVILSGRAGASDPACQALVRACAVRYLPDLFVIVAEPDQPLPAEFEHLRSGKRVRDGLPTAYLCCGPRCTAPLIDPSAVTAQLLAPG